MLETWLLLVAVLMAVWWYSRWRHSYWSSKGVPSQPTLPMLGHIHQTFTEKNMWMAADIAYRNYGGSRFSGRYEIFNPVLLIGDPDILKQILVKDFDHFVDRRVFGDQKGSVMSAMLSNMVGEEWKNLRSIISPTFSSGKMRKMFPLVCENANALVASCLQDAAGDPLLDMKDKFGRFTMDTIASCAFGIECKSITQDKPVFTQKAETFFSMSLYKFSRFFLLLFFPKLFNVLGMKADSPEIDFFRDVVVETIKSRQSSSHRGDFLDLLLEVRATTGTDTPTSAKHVLTDHTVLAQCILFLIAGYDTTASTLAFSAHLLAENPEEQRRLRKELKELVKKEGELSYEGVMESKLLDACIMETLRMYPPAAIGERKCTKAYTIPGTEVTIKKNDIIQFPIWSLHHDPRYWPEPEQFRPDRFMPENKAKIRSFTHMPFGMGPRNCLAMRFALMEAKVALAKLLMVADLQVAPGHEKIVLEKYAFLVRPEDGCNILVKPLNEE